MNNPKLLHADIISAVLPAAANAGEVYSGYGYEPIKGDRIGDNEH